MVRSPFSYRFATPFAALVVAVAVVFFLGTAELSNADEIEPDHVPGFFTIQHQQVVITVEGLYLSAEPLVGLKVYLYTSAGSYQGQYQLTDTNGQVSFSLPDQEYKVRVDYLGEQPRFEMVYHLYSVGRNRRLRVKARVPEEPAEIDTLTELWSSANWMEREVWDMYGIRFKGHPNLRRLLLYEEFEGHPLRKDYPKERRQPLVGPRN